MRKSSTQPGYVLLMALVLILLAGVALAGLARRSLVRAVEVEGTLEDLQRRWAVTTCRATLLGRTEKLIDRAERGKAKDGSPSETYLNSPMPELHIACTLAGIDYELVFTDEQTKLNLNELLDQEGRASLRSILVRLIERSGAGRSTNVHLRPLTFGTGAARSTTGLPPFGGYGQIFDDARPQDLLGTEDHPGLAVAVTCWGDGRINLRRASPAVLEQVCGTCIEKDAIAALLAARDRDPYRALSALLTEVDEIDDHQRTTLSQRLTDRSTCHGLWVIVRQPQRSFYTLAIAVTCGPSPAETDDETSAAAVRRIYEFEW